MGESAVHINLDFFWSKALECSLLNIIIFNGIKTIDGTHSMTYTSENGSGIFMSCNEEPHVYK